MRGDWRPRTFLLIRSPQHQPPRFPTSPDGDTQRVIPITPISLLGIGCKENSRIDDAVRPFHDPRVHRPSGTLPVWSVGDAADLPDEGSGACETIYARSVMLFDCRETSLRWANVGYPC